MREDIGDRERDALIEALKRFGYTFIQPKYMWDFSEYGYAYIREELEGWDRPLHAEDIKPYYIYFGTGTLDVIHETCTKCAELPRRVHEVQFLQELVPIIGKLDARAVFDNGDGIDGPWLHIAM